MVLNIYKTVHNYNIKKSGIITGKAAIFGTPNRNEYMGCVCGRNPTLRVTFNQIYDINTYFGIDVSGGSRI